jgi:sugar phosphate isomerase/epimerase
MLFGTSTSVLQDKSDLEYMLGLEPEIVEFYNYSSSALPRVEEFCRTRKLAIALHAPTPYDSKVPLRRFAPTGPDPQEARAALEMALATVRCAARLNAIHVVVHFPSPYADCAGPITEQTIDAFLEPLMNEAERLCVSILVENLSGHPTFYSPDHYLALSDRYSKLGYCLDIGHAADLDDTDPEDYIRVLGRRIRSCHVYNRKRGAHHGHVPVHPAQRPEEGWIDIVKAIAALKDRGAVRTWILEPDPVGHGDWALAKQGAMWLRDLVSGAAADAVYSPAP